jgi:hypothetical protein
MTILRKLICFVLGHGELFWYQAWNAHPEKHCERCGRCVEEDE